ncbi:MAG: FAD-dependent oxidoreductase [Myxococcota bacterium]
MASIVVVGAGLGGLVCATKLARAGHAVCVVEAQPAAGGRFRVLATEHGPLAPGVGEIGEGDPNLRALLGSLGLDSDDARLVERRHALVLGAKLHRPPPLRPWEVLVPRLSPRMDRPIDAVFLRRPRWRERRGVVRALWDASRRGVIGTPESVRALDDQTWSRASTRAFGTRWCTTRLGPTLLARTGVDLSAESAAVVVPMLTRLWAGGGRAVPLPGGPSTLIERLAAALPIRTGCRVEGVESTPDGVRIQLREGGREESIGADAVVLAIPPSEILRIAPKLTPIERGYFESFEPRRSIVLYRLVSDPAWLLRGLGGVTFVPGEIPDMRDLRILGTPEPTARAEPFWVRISFELAAVDASWTLSDQAIAAKVDAAFRGSPLGDLPSGPSRVDRIGELMSVQGRGALARREPFDVRSERTPRLAFATEARTTPDLEGRVTVGLRAAAEAMACLDRSDAAGRDPADAAGRDPLRATGAPGRAAETGT